MMFTRRGTSLLTRLSQAEASVLGTMAGQLADLVAPLSRQSDDIVDSLAALAEADGSGAPSSDPALRRLFPDAYRDDAAASREYRHYTQSDDAQLRAEAARTVVQDVTDADDGWVTIAPGHVYAWLTTLNNLRLVLATRLDIETEADAEALDRLPRTDRRAPTAAVYNWCGWMLESLLDSL